MARKLIAVLALALAAAFPCGRKRRVRARTRRPALRAGRGARPLRAGTDASERRELRGAAGVDFEQSLRAGRAPRSCSFDGLGARRDRAPRGPARRGRRAAELPLPRARRGAERHPLRAPLGPRRDAGRGRAARLGPLARRRPGDRHRGHRASTSRTQTWRRTCGACPGGDPRRRLRRRRQRPGRLQPPRHARGRHRGRGRRATPSAWRAWPRRRRSWPCACSTGTAAARTRRSSTASLRREQRRRRHQPQPRRPGGGGDTLMSDAIAHAETTGAVVVRGGRATRARQQRRVPDQPVLARERRT